jgi:hypothetical protein
VAGEETGVEAVPGADGIDLFNRDGWRADDAVACDHERALRAELDDHDDVPP